MDFTGVPSELQAHILKDAVQRDRTTARRACLLALLWRERAMTRAQLMTRMEALLGRGCFGSRAWDDTFYRDMVIVKQAFSATGFKLIYRRGRRSQGYQLLDQPVLAPDLAQAIRGSIAEVDLSQIAVLRKLSVAERFRLGCSVTDTARQVVAYRQRLRNATFVSGNPGQPIKQ